MSYGSDPYEAGQREALRATDALLDRIGSRVPTPEDLDDPLAAALALMAAEIDVDAVPVEVTRAAVERDLADLHLAGPAVQSENPDAVVDERTGLVIDLRDVPASTGDPDADVPPRGRLARAAAALRPADEGRRPRPLRRPTPRPTPPAPGAIAPPRSLPRSSSRPEGRQEVRRPRRLNPAAVFVLVIAALALGTGISAVVTGGQSLNPLTGLQQVVAQITEGRTVEQRDLYAKANSDLQQAQTALDHQDQAAARSWLKQYDALKPKLSVLTAEDKTALEDRRASIQRRLDG
jgi:hypothetical protein